MRKYYYLIVILATLLASCSSDETILPDEPLVSSENSYYEFNQWAYHQMNQNYYWRTDLPDSVSCNYDLAPKDFFYSLLSEKDHFSYFTSNPDYNKQQQTDWGFEYQPCIGPDGKEYLYVLYALKDSDASRWIKRGDILKTIDFNSGLFKKCIISDNRLREVKTIKLNPNYASSNNSVYTKDLYYIDNHIIGYFCYLEYADISDLCNILSEFKIEEIDELILDLRYNPGGYLSTCKYLCNSLVKPEAYGQVFQKCGYNDILSAKYLRQTGSAYTFSYYDYPPQEGDEVLGSAIQTLGLNRLFVLTSSHTASASEATIICLKPYMDVIVIGETTVGKGVGSWTIYDSNYKLDKRYIISYYH